MLRPDEAKEGTRPDSTGAETMVKTPGSSVIFVSGSTAVYRPKVASVCRERSANRGATSEPLTGAVRLSRPHDTCDPGVLRRSDIELAHSWDRI